MVKRLLSSIVYSFRKYALDTVIRYLLFKKGIFNGLFFWFLFLIIIITDIKLSVDKSRGLGISIIVAVAVVLFFLIIGYFLYLSFDYIPKSLIIKKILPIRNKLDEIIKDSEITKHNFTESYEIKKIDNIINLTRIPDEKVLEIWLYKLKVQRNVYIILSPLLYVMLSTISIVFQNIHVKWVENIYTFFDDLLKSPPPILQMLKGLFVVFVVTNEAIEINIDISRVELLKGLSKIKK